LTEEEGYPPRRVFLQKSSESLENKRVEFFVSAKECKRVPKSLRINGIGN